MKTNNKMMKMINNNLMNSQMMINSHQADKKILVM